MTIQSRWRARRVTRIATEDYQGDTQHRASSLGSATVEPPETGALTQPVNTFADPTPDSAVSAGAAIRANPPELAAGTDAGTVTPFTPVRTPKAAVVIAQTLRSFIVNGQLNEGDYLPNETQLMEQYEVSRSTLREAVRLLEAERLVEVRRGARTGARVRIPGPESVARPAGLLLQVSGATIGDVMAARLGIEPLAARLLAEKRTTLDLHRLGRLLHEDMPAAKESGRILQASAKFHALVVELSGNATLNIFARTLYEITERHTSAAPKRLRNISDVQYQSLLHTYRELIEMVRVGDADAAEAHWRNHLRRSLDLVPIGVATAKVRDVTD
jgi:GntR family transcriptional repressor for pyruvate dehydrogenase complex